MAKFSMEDLGIEDKFDMLYGDNGIKVIQDTVIDTSRWSVHHELVFKLEGKHYITYYSRGATESQEESPWEYDQPEIWEAEQVQTVSWVTRKDNKTDET